MTDLSGASNFSGDPSGDLVVRVEGATGRITLNRPDALNALTHAMVQGIREALDQWRDDPRVSCVVVDGTGERAFCGGGDIRFLYDRGRSDPASCRAFWRDEYRLNAAIAHYPKPYVALMRGIVMGGGIGISAHGSHRIVTDNSLLAMPEVSIGFLPDVGGSLLLARAPGALGLYLGLTAARFGAADAIRAGFADRFVPARDLPALVEALVAGEPIDELLEDLATITPPGPLGRRIADIDRIFAADTLKELIARLDAQRADTGDEGARDFASFALDGIRRNAPLSVACAFRTINQAREFKTIEESLRLEYRFAWRSIERGDLYEGIRAAIISRDTPPEWDPASLADVSDELADAMLAPLGKNELTFGR
ncbi:MAG: enoyl-CoA hydratase/isomerase family protein [Rhodospirillaceae bacterium]|nr:enoyl-CoA hydratase/isomerase family protein [Rhodospirillaceae bacterium]